MASDMQQRSNVAGDIHVVCVFSTRAVDKSAFTKGAFENSLHLNTSFGIQNVFFALEPFTNDTNEKNYTEYDYSIR